ncbi:MAG: Uncharacterized protein AWU57_74 [Marinobacter sp. T13-3]|nr:MAG: Uncharacterized protein AWU57_74 [Marinobacter sp. T13-3]
MFKTLKFMPFALASCVLAGGASAASADQQYAAFSLGQADVKDFCDDLSGAGVNCDDEAVTGRITAGGFFDKYLAFEGGYRYIDDTSFAASGVVNGNNVSAAMDVSYHMFDGSLLVFTPDMGPVRLFAKAGAQFWYQKFDGSITVNGSKASGSESETGVGFRTGLGAVVEFSDHFAVRAEWDYLSNVGDDLDSGLSNLESDMHIFSIGPELRF